MAVAANHPQFEVLVVSSPRLGPVHSDAMRLQQMLDGLSTQVLVLLGDPLPQNLTSLEMLPSADRALLLRLAQLVQRGMRAYVLSLRVRPLTMHLLWPTGVQVREDLQLCIDGQQTLFVPPKLRSRSSSHVLAATLGLPLGGALQAWQMSLQELAVFLDKWRPAERGTDPLPHDEIASSKPLRAQPLLAKLWAGCTGNAGRRSDLQQLRERDVQVVVMPADAPLPASVESAARLQVAPNFVTSGGALAYRYGRWESLKLFDAQV